MSRTVYFLLFVALTMVSCSSYPQYEVSLYKVESPENAKQQYGETKIVDFKDENLTKYIYEDDYIKIAWFTKKTMFDFYLVNKTDHSLKIPWDEMAYVDINGQAGRVTHSGMKYAERNYAQPASVVPKGAYLADVVIPTANIYFDDFLGEWRVLDIIQLYGYETKAERSAIVGKRMKIVFPIIIENITNEYIFEFRVDETTSTVYSIDDYSGR